MTPSEIYRWHVDKIERALLMAVLNGHSMKDLTLAQRNDMSRMACSIMDNGECVETVTTLLRTVEAR